MTDPTPTAAPEAMSEERLREIESELPFLSNPNIVVNSEWVYETVSECCQELRRLRAALAEPRRTKQECEQALTFDVLHDAGMSATDDEARAEILAALFPESR